MSTTKLVPIAAISLCLACGSAHAEAWIVTEGETGAITGIWNVTITNGSISGDAVMTTEDHKPLTYALTGQNDGNSWLINRVKPSDGNECTYTGTSPITSGLKKPTEISGSAMCQSKTGIWKVRLPNAK
jgi:hypothetical protein